ncbi:MAG TPA: hypothetical protein VLI39_12950, partial [Sedimentisphaerales bacterium]|nr:hypothetical protein [Sedimentisphaerales bacterium]
AASSHGSSNAVATATPSCNDPESNSASNCGKHKPLVSHALWTAVPFLTETIQVLGFSDDSCGVIGDSFQAAFREYLALDHAAAGIEETVFLHDLLMLLIWEDYGLTYRQTDGYFHKLSREQGQICIDFLRRQIERLEAEDLDYQAQEALTLLGQVVCEQRRYELFITLAREMKSDHWRRILLLADTAMRVRKRDLAMLVFEAALQPGFHYDLLRRHYEQLQRAGMSVRRLCGACGSAPAR